jgi:rod shape-determining protein MreD
VIVTPWIFARLALLVLVTVLVQVGFFSQVPLLGSVANVVPVVVVALGLLGGAVSGAVSGFAAGLLLDVTIGGTPGVASLALMSAGYLAGRWREGYDIVSSLVPPLITGALCAVSAACYGLLQLTLGVDAQVSALAIREVIVQGVLGVLLAVPVFPLVRRILRPALVEDSSRRARVSPNLLGGGSRPSMRLSRAHGRTS